MNTVQPIRDIDLVNDIAKFLKGKCIRDYMMFIFGIYSGLRISDILKLKVKNVRNLNHVKIIEKKTKKEKLFYLHPLLKRELKEYIKDMDENEFLFKSRQGYNRPISAIRAWQILKDIAKQFKIDSLGTHSMRKTFGFIVYQQTHDIAVIQDIFNHSDPSITMRYIGLSQARKDEIIKNIKIIGS